MRFRLPPSSVTGAVTTLCRSLTQSDNSSSWDYRVCSQFSQVQLTTTFCLTGTTTQLALRRDRTAFVGSSTLLPDHWSWLFCLWFGATLTSCKSRVASCLKLAPCGSVIYTRWLTAAGRQKMSTGLPSYTEVWSEFCHGWLCSSRSRAFSKSTRKVRSNGGFGYSSLSTSFYSAFSLTLCWLNTVSGASTITLFTLCSRTGATWRASAATSGSHSFLRALSCGRCPPHRCLANGMTSSKTID